MMMMDMGREAVALIHERNVQVVVNGKWNGTVVVKRREDGSLRYNAKRRMRRQCRRDALETVPFGGAGPRGMLRDLTDVG